MEKKKEETTLKEQIDALAVQVEKLTEQVKLLSEMTGKKKRAAKGERTDKQKAQQEKFKKVNLDYNLFQIQTKVFMTVLGSVVSMGAFVSSFRNAFQASSPIPEFFS